jgi:colanic acid/amylovoran biosynthesis protein
MLPQAFGPFQDPVKRDATIRLLNFCHTIYARDEISLEHLRELKLAADIQGPTPDITHLLAGREPEDPTEWARRVCVVPNARMLDRTSSDTAQRYTAFMQRVLQIVRDKALEPVLVVHETFDLPLAQHLATADAAGVRILHKDAITTKGLLGASYAVIGSRYHALVSALSQVTPSLATSWSHKYGELFRDYGCPENILSMDSDLPTLEAQASAFLEPDRRNQLRERLTARASHHRQRVEEMWQRVETILWQEASARRR